MINYIYIANPRERSLICENILGNSTQRNRGEKSFVVYINNVRTMQTWAASFNRQIVGFISVEMISSRFAKIHVMGVAEDFQFERMVRVSLIETAKIALIDQGVNLLKNNESPPANFAGDENSIYKFIIDNFSDVFSLIESK